MLFCLDCKTFHRHFETKLKSTVKMRLFAVNALLYYKKKHIQNEYEPRQFKIMPSKHVDVSRRSESMCIELESDDYR